MIVFIQKKIFFLKEIKMVQTWIVTCIWPKPIFLYDLLRQYIWFDCFLSLPVANSFTLASVYNSILSVQVCNALHVTSITGKENRYTNISIFKIEIISIRLFLLYRIHDLKFIVGLHLLSM